MGQGDMCLTGFYKLGYERNDMVVECKTGCSGHPGQREEEVGGWVGGWVFNGQHCHKSEFRVNYAER